MGCARHGDRDLIFALTADRSALEKFRTGDDETLLFIACNEGNLETATALLDIGLSPNARDRRKASILSKLCNGRVKPNAEIVRLLLSRGADPTLHGTLTPMIFDRCGYALPLNGCAIDCFLDCAKVLFNYVKNVNQQQKISHFTPIMCACHPLDRHKHQHRSLDMITWLIQCGADLEIQSKSGLTPLDFALGGSSNPENIKLENISSPDILQILWKSGARPSERFKQVCNLIFSKL